MGAGKLYLIPSTLGEEGPGNTIPQSVVEVVNSLDAFVVEKERTARRYLRKIGFTKSFEEVLLFPLNKHVGIESASEYLQLLLSGKNVGLLSEAGCPGVADPGADVVALAHHHGIQTIPLVGPSSLLLALMASGLNGQSFVFHGYLPKDRNQRIRKIRELEREAKHKNQTQLFIETPFRNDHMLQDLLSNCNPDTRLCIATDLTLSSEQVKTRSITDWKKAPPALHKKPTVFLLL